MAGRVEVKARARDPALLAGLAERLSGSPARLEAHSDTFFAAPRGRLKLRHSADGHGQLIFYERPDAEGPKLCCCAVSPTEDPAGLTAVLSQALGVRGVVKKERRVYQVGQTRVHLDRVEGLGDFMELEVVLEEHQSPQEGALVAQQLMAELGIDPEDLLPGAYLDLLGEEAAHP
ncbi:adenylate cyclase CyaB-like isoform X1 [Paroedura picta]|uniref:adenylate cyclase CyaB-like isoform X1 n=1 Tax=Paroedura picta TaxID=143630 RepID=UPI0040579FD0